MKAHIEKEEDEFFGTRYRIVRADGVKYPPVSLEYAEHILRHEDCQEGGEYVIACREKNTAPYRKAHTVNATCPRDAEIKAWIRCLIPDDSQGHPLFHIFHSEDWTQYETAKHLKQIGIKLKR